MVSGDRLLLKEIFTDIAKPLIGEATLKSGEPVDGKFQDNVFVIMAAAENSCIKEIAEVRKTFSDVLNESPSIQTCLEVIIEIFCEMKEDYVQRILSKGISIRSDILAISDERKEDLKIEAYEQVNKLVLNGKPYNSPADKILALDIVEAVLMKCAVLSRYTRKNIAESCLVTLKVIAEMKKEAVSPSVVH